MNEELTIVAAAIRKNGKIYQGRRHAEIMLSVLEETGGEYITQEEQGFLASDGKFYNRFQSGAIAYRSHQTKTRHRNLLSEHLW